MDIIEATRTAMKEGKGIINMGWQDPKSYYLLPTNTTDCFLLTPIGFSATEGRACPRWNPRACDILSDKWEIYEDIISD